MIMRDKQLRKARRGNSELEWSKYKRMKNRVNNLVKSNKNSYYRELLRKNSNNPRNFWKTIKEIYPSNKCKESRISINIDNEQITDKSMICRSFSNFFHNVTNELKNKSFPLTNFIWKF